MGDFFSQGLRDFQSENKRFVVGAATPQWLTQLKTDSGQENLKNTQFELSAQMNTEFLHTWDSNTNFNSADS